jgi:formate dehydrogenase major subunit
MTNSIEEIDNAQTIFVIGSNTTENHPVIGSRIKRAVKNGVKLIVADPRKIELSRYADVFMQVKPGTNVALLNGMMNVIIAEGLYDKDFIGERTENFEELKNAVKEYTPENAERITGVPAGLIREAARLYAGVSRSMIFYAMGITQHSTGTQHVFSIANLAMLCGMLGRESTGVNPLRGQNNVQGACDMGCLPDVFPGYQRVKEPDTIRKFEYAWGVKLSDRIGLTVSEIINESGDGSIKALYIMGENPMVSDPDLNHVRKALEGLEFLAVQDIFLTETAEHADVVLPAASFAEKDGTFTNTERRIQRVRQAIAPVGDCKPDWEIIMRVMNRMGCKKVYGSPSEIMEEIAGLVPQYAGINYERIDKEGLQWPCPSKEHPGTRFLHLGKFARGKGLFKAVQFVPPKEEPDDEYSFILTTGRILYHYHTRTMTGRVEGLNALEPESYIEINPKTANRLLIKDGDKVRISSRRGAITIKARVTDRVGDNVVFIPFHFAEGAANVLTNTVFDSIAKIPELKVCAVKLEKAGE